MSKAELHRSRNLVVRRIPAADTSRWVVTFDNYGAGHGFSRPAFGEAFLKAAGISAVHVMGRSEDWYQYPDTAEALAAVRAALAGAARVITYGSSMGGYAALRFADAVGATGVLALSPQYSVDPLKVPFEQRWLQDGARIRWRPEIDGELTCAVPALVAYDPFDDDRRHVDLIAAEIAVTRLPLPRFGHPVTTTLADMGVLAPLLRDVLDGRADVAAVLAEARRKRSASASYQITLAAAQPSWRARTGLTLAERAHALAQTALVKVGLARQLARSGRHDEAQALHEAVAATKPRPVSFIVAQADDLTLAGRHAEAAAMAAEATAAAPGMAHLRLWQGVKLWQAGDKAAARAAVQTAVDLDPARAYYRDVLALYQGEPGEPEAEQEPPDTDASRAQRRRLASRARQWVEARLKA